MNDKKSIVRRPSFPKVREFKKKGENGQEYTYFQVDCRSEKYGIKGAGSRHNFNSLTEALNKAKEVAEILATKGKQGLADINPEVTRRAERYQLLADRLSPHGKTPEEAVSHLLKHIDEEAKKAIKPTVAKLVDDYLEFKLLKHKGEIYENEIQTACRFLKSTWGNRKIDELRKNEIDSDLTKLKPHTGTRKKYLTHTKMFFRWVIGEDKGYLATSPIETLTYEAKKFAKEHIYANEAKSLLLIVREIHPELIGYYAALTFVGLRPSEGGRLVWSDINFETMQLRVNDDGKTGHRYCLLEPVALAWLKYHWEKCENGTKPFIPEKSLDAIRAKGKTHNGYNLFLAEKEVRQAFKEKCRSWASDILRHTFATHYVSLIQDEPKAAYYMGNTVAVIKKHYAKRLPKSELDAFWNLTPEVAFAEPLEKAA